MTLKRRPLYPTFESLEGPKPAIAYYRVGGREYPIATSNKCHTCRSEFRAEIEELVLIGFSYQKVVDSLPEGHGLTRSAIGDHVRNHMPLKESAKRVIIEQRAEEIGLNIEKHNGQLADHVTLMRLGIQRTIERLTTGEISPDMTDGIALVKAMIQLEELQQGGVDQAALMQGFLAYMQSLQATLQEFAPDQARAMMQAFSRRLSGDPIMKSLLGRVEQQDEVIEAEVLPIGFYTDDDAPANDSAGAKLYPVEVVTDYVPEPRDFATAKVIPREHTE